MSSFRGVSGGKVWVSDKEARALPLRQQTFYVELGGRTYPMAGWFMLSLSSAVAIFIGVFALVNWLVG